MSGQVPEEAKRAFVDYAEEHSGQVINEDLWIPALQAAAPAICKGERERVELERHKALAYRQGEWPAAFAAHRVKGQQPIFLFKGAKTLPDDVPAERLETEIYVPEANLLAERDQAAQQEREKLEAHYDHYVVGHGIGMRIAIAAQRLLATVKPADGKTDPATVSREAIEGLQDALRKAEPEDGSLPDPLGEAVRQERERVEAEQDSALKEGYEIRFKLEKALRETRSDNKRAIEAARTWLLAEHGTKRPNHPADEAAAALFDALASLQEEGSSGE